MAEEKITNDSSKNTDTCESSGDVQIDMFSDTWGFTLEDLYKIAVTFYKGLYIIFRDRRFVLFSVIRTGCVNIDGRESNVIILRHES